MVTLCADIISQHPRSYYLFLHFYRKKTFFFLTPDTSTKMTLYIDKIGQHWWKITNNIMKIMIPQTG